MNSHELIADAQHFGGGTYIITGYDAQGWHFEKPRLRDGFYVGNSGGIENLPNAALTPEVIAAFINQYHGTMMYFGLWRDASGKWSVDNVDHFEDFEEALIFGHLNDQRTIWDIAWGTEWNVAATMNNVAHL